MFGDDSFGSQAFSSSYFVVVVSASGYMTLESRLLLGRILGGSILC